MPLVIGQSREPDPPARIIPFTPLELPTKVCVKRRYGFTFVCCGKRRSVEESSNGVHPESTTKVCVKRRYGFTFVCCGKRRSVEESSNGASPQNLPIDV
jgi:hypothetical protein